MASNYIITEWLGEKQIQKFIVSSPSVGEPNFYRNTVSLDSFRNREVKRCFGQGANPKHRKGRRFSIRPEWEYDAETEQYNLQTTNILDIWEFYKQINYNYKKQTYGH